MPKVVYIGGYGRSGSTLIDTILGTHPEVLGGGELERFFTDVVEGGSCTCGQKYLDCELWGKVLADLGGAESITPELADQLHRAESMLGPVLGLRQAKSNRATAIRKWSDLFDSAARHYEGTHIVDSSKSSRASARRISLLAARHDIVVVHLTRDPRAVAYSEMKRGNNDKLESGDRRMSSNLWGLRPLLGWAMANMAVEVTARRNPSLRVVHVRYEDFVADPAASIEQICRAADLTTEPILEAIRSEFGIETGHGVRGNRMRRQAGPIVLKSDRKWVEHPSTTVKIMASPLRRMAMRYGYDLRSWPML